MIAEQGVGWIHLIKSSFILDEKLAPGVENLEKVLTAY